MLNLMSKKIYNVLLCKMMLMMVSFIILDTSFGFTDKNYNFGISA